MNMIKKIINKIRSLWYPDFCPNCGILMNCIGYRKLECSKCDYKYYNHEYHNRAAYGKD